MTMDKSIPLLELLEESANDVDYAICLTPVESWQAVQDVLFDEIFELLRDTCEDGPLEYGDNV